MSNQLPLLALDEPRGRGIDWQLDEHTRRVGRLGVFQARQALRQAGREATPATDDRAAA